MLSIPIERTLDVVEARTRLEEALKRSGISWKTETTGRFIFTAKTTLYDEFGAALDYGYGKGDIESSKTGSMFEAAEHWFSQFSNSSKENVHHEDSHTFAVNCPLRDNLPISSIAEARRATIALREYTRIGASEQMLYPIALSDPKYIDGLYSDRTRYHPDNFDYLQIERYSTNSGVAIGSTKEEAVVHGLLEAIERDSLSRFLVQAFLHRDSTAIRVVQHKSFPDSLSRLLMDAEREVGHKVVVVELGNDFDIPVFCSALQSSDFPIEIAGYGCSLSREHAVSRSLFELTQCYHATTRFHPEEFKNKTGLILSKLSEYPFHLRCAKLKIAEWGGAIGTEVIDFADTAHLMFSTDVSAYLAQILERIETNGRQAYSAVVNRLSGGQVVAHSMLNQQDHFFCVTEGSFVFPNLGAEARSNHGPQPDGTAGAAPHG